MYFFSNKNSFFRRFIFRLPGRGCVQAYYSYYAFNMGLRKINSLTDLSKSSLINGDHFVGVNHGEI